MPTQIEEQQVRDFLKRAEVKTMKKDLRALREADALKERDRIIQLKTLEEQLEAQKLQREKEKAQNEAEKIARYQVLEKNAEQERIAEKDLKNYGTEEERQQIFLLESERFDLENQIDLIDKKRDPDLKLEKNNLLIKLQDWQTKLNTILEEEQKLENEEKFLAEKEQTSTIPAEKKGLETSRWDIEKKIQEVEKKRWEVEKQIENIKTKITQIDKSLDELVNEKNQLRNKILGIDKSLREIYSAIIAREEERRRGELEEQRAQREKADKIKLERNENIRRQQWTGVPIKKAQNERQALIEKLTKSAQIEKEEREKFLRNVEILSATGSKPKNEIKNEIEINEKDSIIKKAKELEQKNQNVSIPPPPHK